VSVIVESFGGNTSASADFLREAVKRLDINGDSGDEPAPADVGVRGEQEGAQTPAEGNGGLPDDNDADPEGANNTKRVAESDLDGPRPKAARTAGGGEGAGEAGLDTSFVEGDEMDEQHLTIVLLVS
jgi:hypothetical protein